MKRFSDLALKVLVTFIIPFVGCGAQTKSITVEELHSLLQTDSLTVLIDVRNENEFVGKMDKIDKAINIPLGELEKRISELEKYKNRPIYLICRSGNRSGRATQMLSEKGYDAINVKGGMLAYSEKYRKEE